MATAMHPWMLTGPWYRWSAPGVPEAGRASPPELQKYAGFDFAAEFLREPQRSLVWKDEDYVHRTTMNEAVLPATLGTILEDADVTTMLAILEKTTSLSGAEQSEFLDMRFSACLTPSSGAAAEALRDAALADMKAALVASDSGTYVEGVRERKGWLLDFLAQRSSVAMSAGAWLREKTQVRKLYKPSHARNYLVVVELHCDRAGLPRVDRREVSEAGFVVRRLRARLDDPEVAAKATAALEQVALVRQQVAYLERNAKGRLRSASGLVLERWLERPFVKKQHELLADWSQGKLQLGEVLASGAVQLETQAWIPDANDPLRGRWSTLADPTPRIDLGQESVLPLHPLIPDPRDPNHTAARSTLYFGVVPTGGREAEADGAPRLDEHHLYEIRSFVRKPPHKPGCPGELVWSPPSIGYRLAPDLDPEGTANLPISITVPSFRDLQSFADRIATGGAGGMRVVQPPDSMMPLGANFPEPSAGPKTGIGQICFFAIILLFIIALFLIFAFLPIIVFLFQLFFLLRLKFCIPPAISLDVDLAVELKASLDFEAGIEFDLEVLGNLAIGAPFASIDAFSVWINGQLADVYEGKLLEELEKAPLATRVQRLVDLRTDFRGSIDPELAADLKFSAWPPGAPQEPSTDPDLAPPLRTGGGSLEYYPRIDPREVFA